MPFGIDPDALKEAMQDIQDIKVQQVAIMVQLEKIVAALADLNDHGPTVRQG